MRRPSRRPTASADQLRRWPRRICRAFATSTKPAPCPAMLMRLIAICTARREAWRAPVPISQPEHDVVGQRPAAADQIRMMK